MTAEPVVVLLPPEVCGCLAHAQRHLDTASRYRWSYYGRYKAEKRKRKHEQKVQKLVAKAARMLARRGGEV